MMIILVFLPLLCIKFLQIADYLIEEVMNALPEADNSQKSGNLYTI